MKRTWSQRNEEYGKLGIIESINLRNFMCHDNLSFEFDPHMNFIVGRNGSGKSAVLTGIILALGGKSGATGRYSNIKGFIKTGKSSATVTVTLKNCGNNAYKPDEFGEKITVERHFTSEGISSYKLKSHAGRIISTSKEELLNILTVMDIQIENPITVLTQDISKNFLVSKNSKADKLFQLFFKGTGLAKVYEDYMRGRQREEEMREELEMKRSILPDMEKEVKKLKSLVNKTSKITELKKELLWSMVYDFEKSRDEAKEALNEKEKIFSDLKLKLNTCENDLNNIQQNMTTAKTEKKTLSDKMVSIRKDLQELNQKRSSLLSETRQVQGTYLSHERQMKKFTTDIKNLENIISEIKMKNQNDLKEEKQKHEIILNSLKSQMDALKHKISASVQHENSLHEDRRNLKQKIDTCHAEIQEMNYAKSNAIAVKQQLMDGKVNRINVFGREMVNALNEINRADESHLFKVKPKGPIGLYINVKEPQWNFAVQECLNIGFLRTFVCDNHADTERLTNIFKKHFQKKYPSIITTKFVNKVYDVTRFKTRSNHPTLLDMLDIRDPVITNCLIDQNRIENILLVEDEREARNLMLYQPPNNCISAYTPNGDQYCHSPYRNYSCRNKNQICILKTVNEEDIRKKHEEILTLENVISEKLKEKDYLINKLEQTEQKINEISIEITHLKINLKCVNEKLNNELTSYEEPKDVNCLQIDLEQLQKEKDHHEGEFVSYKTVLNQKTDELNSLNENINEFQRNLQVESRNFHSLCEKVDDFENKKEKYDSVINKIKEKLKLMQPDLIECQKEVANCEATVRASIQNAESTGDRVETRRSPDTIRQILKETEKFIQQQRNCDRESILKEYEEKFLNLTKKKAELERLDRMNVRIREMIAMRLKTFNQTCNNTAVSLTCVFTQMLNENDFSGYTLVELKKQTLEIFAKPKKSSSKNNDFTNLSQLSGGERSYVTIAFLLSLWDRINMPFRILDEYDVFMDSNNRHLSINLLINSAKTNKKIQYIFLSPLELPDINDCDHVKVHKMPPPRK